ncbi:MAG: AAA domain-containing protein, partial [Candidatus Kariarchaeaceae archaeon]
MGELSKQVFNNYAEFECQRKLFLDLGSGDARWIYDLRKIIPLTRHRVGSQLLADMGHDYEQMVYGYIKILPGAKFNPSSTGKVTYTTTQKELLLDYYNQLQDQANDLKELCLLEHKLVTPEIFIKFLLGQKEKEDLIIEKYSGTFIPDILLIGNKVDETQSFVRELLPDGTERVIPRQELQKRVGINIFDVKASSEESIGKKQFIEILYYAWALSFYLQEQELTDYFFVRVDHNGILPNTTGHLSALDSIREKSVTLKWDESKRIFEYTLEQIRELVETIPLALDATEVKIQPSCGRCNYLEDCKHTLGMADKEPSDWSIKLLPYTRNSIAHQLIAKGYETIGDVDRNIANYQVSDIPEPINPELPFLRLKARALVSGEITTPSPGEVHSLAIPRYSQMNILFNPESDPVNERLFLMGFRLSMFVHKIAKYAELFEDWWAIWSKWIDSPGIKLEELHEDLIVHFEELTIDEVDLFADLLAFLEERCKEEKRITLLKDGSVGTSVVYSYAYVNGGLKDQNEFQLAKNTIRVLHKMIKLCNIIEKHVRVRLNPEEEFYVAPTLALFYWSREQLKAIEDLLERNLVALITDNELREEFNELVNWVGPSKSTVTDPYQHKKIYDLRVFLETTMGIPSVINYTWHEMAERKGIRSSKKFWTPHFNYMDFEGWHNYLLEEDTTEKAEKGAELRRQAAHKLRTIDGLRVDFQVNHGQIISRKADPIRSSEVGRKEISQDYHTLGHIWYLYSKLNGTMSELEADYFRAMYPEFSIGKLRVGEVEELLEVSREGKKRVYSFKLKGLSTNVKIKEGDHVKLIPEELKEDSRDTRFWRIIIAEMNWLADENSYWVLTEEISNDKLINELEANSEGVWYLFPHSRDYWTSKLYNRKKKNGLLQKRNMGRSRLGEMLATKMGYSNVRIVDQELAVSSAEMYLYAPLTLNGEGEEEEKEEEKEKGKEKGKLETSIFPPPDHSQERAIRKAMGSTISLIQGPPGTGKSQTIAALVDEFICRKKGPVKILITAFSYAALQVMVEKIRKSKYSSSEGSKASRAAETQMIYLRSASSEAVRSEEGVREVDDMVRVGSAWELNGEGRLYQKGRRYVDDKFEDSFIMFGNAHQLYHLGQIRNTRELMYLSPGFAFDLIIVDEASQLPVDQFLASMQFVKNYQLNTHIDGERKEVRLKGELEKELLTKVVIVGDHNQLPPVQPIKPPEKLKLILDSLFYYYTEGHGLSSTQLELNYRSHEDIVNYTAKLGFYTGLRAAKDNALRVIEGSRKGLEEWVSRVLEPEEVISTIIHFRDFETAVSPIEAKIVVELI